MRGLSGPIIYQCRGVAVSADLNWPAMPDWPGNTDWPVNTTFNAIENKFLFFHILSNQTIKLKKKGYISSHFLYFSHSPKIPKGNVHFLSGNHSKFLVIFFVCGVIGHNNIMFIRFMTHVMDTYLSPN